MRAVIPAALDGERLDRVVSLLLGVSRSEAAARVDRHDVLVDGRPTPGKAKVRTGQVVEVVGEVPAAPEVPLADPSVPVPVVHVDDHVIVVDKPAGLVVHPGAGTHDGTLVNGLLARFPELAEVGDPGRPGIVHRLDRGTSGLLVVARTAEAYEHLVDDLAARAVTRVYLALVWGLPSSPRGLIDAPVGRSRRHPTRMAVTVDGREARTGYEVQRTYHEPVDCALVTCRLETGRTHQIRVHLAALGHPVVGDATYGGDREGLAAARPMLHAWRLAFDHPATGERISLEAPLPADMEAVLARLA